MSTDPNVAEFLRQVLAAAAAQRIPSPPVVLSGFTITRNDGTVIVDDLVTSVATATPDLQKQARGAGQLAVREMVQDAIKAQAWACILTPEDLTLFAFHAGVEVFRVTRSLDIDPAKDQTTLEQLNDERPAKMGMLLRSGQRIMIYGRTGADAALSGSIVAMFSSGELTMPHPHQRGATITIPMNEKRLVQMLLGAYADNPHIIAEAIRALRQIEGDPSRKLTRLLRTRPELARLNRLVRFELDGTTA